MNIVARWRLGGVRGRNVLNALRRGRPVLPVSASPRLRGQWLPQDPHAGFFMEVLKGRRLHSAQPYGLNSFLPLQARAAQPQPGGDNPRNGKSTAQVPTPAAPRTPCIPAAPRFQTQRYGKR